MHVVIMLNCYFNCDIKRSQLLHLNMQHFPKNMSCPHIEYANYSFVI